MLHSSTWFGDIDIDSLEYRVITLAWDDEYEDQDLVDQIAVELVYIKDGVSDESIFRERVTKIEQKVLVAEKYLKIEVLRYFPIFCEMCPWAISIIFSWH